MPSDSHYDRNVTILSGRESGRPEHNAKRIAEFAGAEVTTLDSSAWSVPDQVPCGGSLIVNAARLAEAAGGQPDGIQTILRLLGVAARVFVYGFESSPAHETILQTLSGGSIKGLQPLTDGTKAVFDVAGDQRATFGPFAGLTVEGGKPGRDACFTGNTIEIGVLICLENRPFFVHLNWGSTAFFLAGVRELADLNEITPYKSGLLPWFSRLIPLLSFLRRSLGEAAWHSDRAQSCIIIDDPLLKPSYGFLDYKRLLEALSSERFCASIGFIPWNYRRTSNSIASLFKRAGQSLSLCVHGCDHTGAEFAERKFEVVRSKASLALERMKRHAELSGVTFDDVMVFPQGLFSVEAIQALGSCGYLAAVNTELCPFDREQELPLGNLMEVALTLYDDLPLFGRHYPRTLAEFAFDIFLGKPAFVVEHHGFFRAGYDSIRTLVQGLNQLDDRLEWASPAAICSRSCLRRTMPGGDVEVQLYTDRFELENQEGRVQKFILRRRLSDRSQVSGVHVNGSPCEFDRVGDHLEFRVTSPASSLVKIQISRVPVRTPSDSRWRPSFRYHTEVLARRFLSEIRDDYVVTNPRLTSVLQKVRSL